MIVRLARVIARKALRVGISQAHDEEIDETCTATELATNITLITSAADLILHFPNYLKSFQTTDHSPFGPFKSAI